MTTKPEILTTEEPGRFTIFPIRFPDIWAMYKNLEGAAWVAGEVDMSQDADDWKNKLSAADRAFYGRILGMFGPADEKVTQNIGDRFVQDFKVKEVEFFYRMQAQNEGVHSESYSIQIQTVSQSPEDAERMFNSTLTMPVVGKLMAWVDTWICSDNPIGERLVAFAFFEGVVFQGMFMSIQLLKERGLLPGITTYNELISRDEGQHCLFACLLLRKYVANRPAAGRIHQILAEAIILVDEFFDDAITAAIEAQKTENEQLLPDEKPTLLEGECPIKGVTAEKMRAYVRSVGDAVCQDMNYPVCYGTENPYPESVKLSLNEVLKTNFFEYIPTQYNQIVDLKFTVDDTRCRPAVDWGAISS